MTTILDICDQERLSAWDAGQLLKAAGDALQKVEHAVIKHVSEEARADAERLIDDVRALQVRVRGIYEVIETEEAELLKRYDDLYHRVTSKRAEIARRIDKIDRLPKIEIPYNTKELLEIAQRCSEMSDEQWSRVVELAKSLRRDGGAS
jgi:hypothetical protein